jgi:hypothetical protein
MHSIIDSHVHLYPPEINQDPSGWARLNAEKHWEILCTRRRKEGSFVQLFPTVTELLKSMDDACVERSVLLGWYWESQHSCDIQNAFYKECFKAHPDRFSVFASIHPSTKGLKARIKQLRDDGFCGLGELSPHSQGVKVMDAHFIELVEVATEFNLPLNIHVSDPEGKRYPGYVETPLEDLFLLIKTFPVTTFILAHYGGLLPIKFPDVLQYKHTYFDTAALPLIYKKATWSHMLNQTERVIFGSDYPLRLYPGSAEDSGLKEFIHDLKLCTEDKDKQKDLFFSSIKSILKL